jgi:hypothetical protein
VSTGTEDIGEERVRALLQNQSERPTENRITHRRMNISRSRAPKPEDGCGSWERGLLAEIRATQIEYEGESRLGDATDTKSGRRLNLTLTLEMIAPTHPDI